MNQQPEKNRIEKLAYELTYHRFILSSVKSSAIFRRLTMSEYIALHRIYRTSDKQKEDKVYLSELCTNMNMSIYQVSKMIKELQEKGLVHWMHDGDGEDGTYITITTSGEEAMRSQTEILKKYYGRVIERFGYERLESFLSEMAALDEVLCNEVREEVIDDTEAE